MQGLRDDLYCVTTSATQRPASLRSVELGAWDEDRDLRCLASLRHLVLGVLQDSDRRMYRLPAGLECLAVYGEGIAYLDVSSCSKDLMVMADRRERLKFVGAFARGACRPGGACRPLVDYLPRAWMDAWIFVSLDRDTEYYKWWASIMAGKSSVSW